MIQEKVAIALNRRDIYLGDFLLSVQITPALSIDLYPSYNESSDDDRAWPLNMMVTVRNVMYMPNTFRSLHTVQESIEAILEMEKLFSAISQ
jgi:hypothetical protein